MSGEITKTGSVGSGPLRIRPHWWAVLAVSLSIFALVAAAASDRPSSPGLGRGAVAAPSGREKGAPSHFASPPTSTAHGSETIPTTSTTSTTVGTPSAASNDIVPTATRPAVKATSTTPATAVTPPKTVTSGTTVTTTTTVTPSASGSSATAPAQQAVLSQFWTGDLQEPDDSRASQSFTGAGPMVVSASWSSTLPLSITVACPADTQTQQGPSKIVLSIPDATGACEITVKETLVQYDAIPYTLTVGPANGG